MAHAGDVQGCFLILSAQHWVPLGDQSGPCCKCPSNPAAGGCGSHPAGQSPGGWEGWTRSGAVYWVRSVARGGLSLAALPPYLLCLCRSVCPSLPRLRTLPCQPRAVRPPRHAWACPHCQSCSDATVRLQWEGSALPAQPRAHRALPPTAQGAGGGGGGAELEEECLSYPLASLVPVHPQRTHSRPTAQSFKSTQPPPRPAQPPPPEASAEPVRSALPARCQAWPRATQHPALPRVSAAAPRACAPWALPSVIAGVCTLPAPGPTPR